MSNSDLTPTVLDIRSAEAAEAAVVQAERAADWAMYAVILSGIALLALLITIYQGRSGLKKAQNANDLAKESAEKQLRAYVAVEPKGVVAPEEGELCFPLELTNRGQTPATNLEIAVDVVVYQGDARQFNPAEDGRITDDSLDTEVSLGPGAHFYHHGTVTDKFVEPHLDEIAEKRKALIHYGKLLYDDIFGERHTTNFAFYHWGEELTDADSKRCRFGNNAT